MVTRSRVDERCSQVHIVDHHVEQSSDINATTVIIEKVQCDADNSGYTALSQNRSNAMRLHAEQ